MVSSFELDVTVQSIPRTDHTATRTGEKEYVDKKLSTLVPKKHPSWGSEEK
jgi:hypothetical protein